MSCAAVTFHTISVTVSGLTGTGLVLQNNGDGNLADTAVTDIAVQCVEGLYNVVDTMQSKCYDSVTGAEAVCVGIGYDADYVGKTTSYALSADGNVVYDNVTGLVWTQTADLTGDGKINFSDKLTQPDAVGYCAGLNNGVHTWRLPSIKELYSLIDLSKRQHFY